MSVKEIKYLFQGPRGKREKEVSNRFLRRKTEDKQQVAFLILGK